MPNQNQAGSAMTVILLVFLSFGLVGALGFGVWAFGERQDYKNNSDKKAAQAVAAAEAAQAAKLETEFAQKEKNPNKTYQGPATYGTITFSYPKTWSAYVDEADTSTPIDGYFHPNEVPGIQEKAVYALRLELLSSSYASILQQYDSQIRSGALKASAFIPEQMAKTANVQPGTRLEGALNTDQAGSVVILKIRDKTLRISTLSTDFTSDFNDIVLKSLKFTP